MTTIVIERVTTSSAKLRFVWRGGSNIDIFWVGGEVPRHVDAAPAEERAPFMNIGVYDHAKGEPMIHNEDEMAARVDEWIDENREDYGL